MTTATTVQNESSWLTVCGAPSPDLERALLQQSEALRSSGELTLDFQRGVEEATFTAVKGSFETSPERGEMLRKLCQIYAVDIQPKEITSHRKFVGPVIVNAKKILFRVLKPLLGPALEQQRNFNASVIYLLVDLCNESRRERSVSGDSKDEPNPRS